MRSATFLLVSSRQIIQTWSRLLFWQHQRPQKCQWTLGDQSHRSALRFFLMARAYYARFGFSIRRVLTDNPGSPESLLSGVVTAPATGMGASVRSCSSSISSTASPGPTPRAPMEKPGSRASGLCLLGWKAERFIQTALREWAYARTYRNSAEREQQLDPWLHDYNFHRPHSSLTLKTPASRAGLNRNNLLTLHK